MGAPGPSQLGTGDSTGTIVPNFYFFDSYWMIKSVSPSAIELSAHPTFKCDAST